MSFTINPVAFQTYSKPSLLSSTNITTSQTLGTSRSAKTLPPQQLQKKFLELYHENEKWKAKKEKLRQQRKQAKSLEDMSECTFQPSINPEISYNGSNPSPFLKRQIDWQQKKEKKIQEMLKQSEKQLKKQCSFHPQISKKTIQILYNPHKSSRAIFSPNNEDSQSGKKYDQTKNGSYREIHMKRQSFKDLQKTNSVHQFTLMTERRFITKMQQNYQTPHSCQQFTFEGIRLNDMKETQNAPKIQSMKLIQGQDYIENIVIKSEEQDTFNSLTSLEMKTQRKDHHEAQTPKQPVKIFEEEQEDLNEQENHQDDEMNQQEQNEDSQDQRNRGESENLNEGEDDHDDFEGEDDCV